MKLKVTLMVNNINLSFKERVQEIVRQIPKGRVMTYGQIALLCGNPKASRIVGGIAHFGNPDLPWHRVVNIRGGLASGYPGGRHGHAKNLISEGVMVNDVLEVNISELLWQPSIEGGILNLEHRKVSSFSKPALIVIVGETTSGKSALAINLAQKFDGEIICADSRTVYKGMDIGTAKPSKKDQKNIKHYLLDVVNPDANFTAAEFKKIANISITEISNRGKMPIMVGGTGLYVDGVIFDFEFDKSSDKKHLRPNTIILGLSLDRDQLKQRIVIRTQTMIDNGLGVEAKKLSEKYGWQSPAMTAIGYREFQPYFAGMQTLAETIERINRNTFLYAKRQRTWFKRNKSIQWLDDPRQAVGLVTTFLNT